MDDIEKRLKHARLLRPSDDLDKRIAQACDAAERRGKSRPNYAVWWWTAALSTSAMAAVAVFPIHHAGHIVTQVPVSEVAVYEFEAQGQMREMLIQPQVTSAAAQPFKFQVNSR